MLTIIENEFLHKVPIALNSIVSALKRIEDRLPEPKTSQTISKPRPSVPDGPRKRCVAVTLPLTLWVEVEADSDEEALERHGRKPSARLTRNGETTFRALRWILSETDKEKHPKKTAFGFARRGFLYR